MSELVKAYDTVSGQKVVVPAHFLGERSPFPQLKPLPSERDSAGKKKPRQQPSTSDAPADAAAATDKEK